jgi:hypothetical protein
VRQSGPGFLAHPNAIDAFINADRIDQGIAERDISHVSYPFVCAINASFFSFVNIGSDLYCSRAKNISLSQAWPARLETLQLKERR